MFEHPASVIRQAVLVCTINILALCSGEVDEEILPGWQGERSRGPTPRAVQRGTSEGWPRDDPAQVASSSRRQWIETISWEPRAFVYHGFLTQQECDHLVKIAHSKLERSMVVGEGGDAIDPIRTSYSASLDLGQDSVVAAIEERIARWTHLPVAHGEGMEVLRYVNGQKYDAHWDWFEDKYVDKASGNRVATVLMYLSDVPSGAGGETAFPLANPLDEGRQSVKGLSACASRMGIAVVPRKGDALLFWDAHPDATTSDRRTLHASCPTVRGAKYTCTKWIHARPL